MLRSYGVETTRGAAALVLDTIVFYLARFVAPVDRAGADPVVLPLEGIQVWMAVGGLAAAGAAGLGDGADLQGERPPATSAGSPPGWSSGSGPRVDPDAWAAAVVRFQKESSSGMVSRMARATPTMLGFILVDAIVVVVCLRFVGIPGEHIGYLAVLAAMFTPVPADDLPVRRSRRAGREPDRADQRRGRGRPGRSGGRAGDLAGGHPAAAAPARADHAWILAPTPGRPWELISGRRLS